ncbi:MAG: SPOR domain-containing protein [Deltaproteobacteria bacterium]|nr:SPOR domain-containing protein [Deltaproteobacteria bacterium]
MKDPRGRLVDPALDPAPSPGAAPPPATDRLPVVPLPAGALLDATPVTREPRDALATLGSEVSTPRADPVPSGADGGYQLQVASFKDQSEADRFVEALRRRGHRAHRQAAYVSDRGLWHRVRIGPFDTKVEAERYRVTFDRAEKMTSFLVDPDKLKRQEEVRAAKLASERQRAR